MLARDLPVSACLFLSLPVSACHCPSLTAYLCPLLPVTTCHHLSLPVTACLCLSPPVSAHSCPSPPVSAHYCPSPPVSACHCLSPPVTTCPSLGFYKHIPLLFYMDLGINVSLHLQSKHFTNQAVSPTSEAMFFSGSSVSWAWADWVPTLICAQLSGISALCVRCLPYTLGPAPSPSLPE